jgi:cyclohexanone monooxygenase
MTISSTGKCPTAFRRRIGIEINGEGGRSLFEHFADGFKTLHSFLTRGFPNWFYIGISQNALSVNMTAMFGEQARHIAYIIKETQARGGVTVQPNQGAQDAWVDLIGKLQINNRAFLEACTPGYYNNERARHSRTLRCGARGCTSNCA